MARALNIAMDNAGFLVSMDSPGFPWVTVYLTTLQLFYLFAESNLLHISPVHRFPCQDDNFLPGKSYLITSTSNETPSFELQAIDTLECTRFHGDSLPEGISEENVVEVSVLLAHDYAQSFQVFEHNLTPHNFRCSTSAHLSLGCKRMFHFWCATKPHIGGVANDRLVIPFAVMMYICPPSMFHFESSQALDSEIARD